jgi:hypothetical protein
MKTPPASFNPAPRAAAPPPPKRIETVHPKLQEAAQAALRELEKNSLLGAMPAAEFRHLTVGEAIAYLAAHRSNNLFRLTAIGYNHAAAEQQADQMWREALPDLVDKHTVLIYLAAVAWGMRSRILNGNEAKLMIFLAQTQLTVFKMEIPGPLQAGALRAPVEQSPQMSLLPDKDREATTEQLL